jgi:uncharacterized membrane protein
MTSLSHTSNSAPIPNRARWMALGGILLAFALRLHRLGAESLWYDETVSVFLAQKSIPDLIAHTARDIHPPGYYLLLHAWAWLAQPTLTNGLEFLYAWPSLFWGMLLLPLVFGLGRRLFSVRVASVGLWLAAVNPYHIWYSQEVRMYTLGAGLGLLCLWGAISYLSSVNSEQSSPRPIHNSKFTIHYSLFLYAISAAAGLYTLYYFAFLLIALNLLVFWWIYAHTQYPISNTRRLRPWLLANGAALLLWSPWLPIFWRQMTEPPVPPWRGALDLGVVMQESLAALLVGQSPPLGMLWPWAAVGLILLGLGLTSRQRRGFLILLSFVFLPLLLIVGISLTLTPLYHIRYFFTYAAAGVLLLAVAIEKMAGRYRWLHAISLAGIVLVSGWSLNEFWTNPLYRSDDHRAAVAELAANWRPGDAVLVNAGWAYTALAVYWPSSPSTSGSQPADKPERTRLLDYTNIGGLAETNPGDETPLLLLGGSVDGHDSLGWGLAESDFYPISAAETTAALNAVAARYPRIWHYRLYDTVSDPTGLVRDWLDANTTSRLDLPYPGRDYLRVQLFETPAFTSPENCPQTPEPAVSFGDGLILRGASYSPAASPGSTLYATLCWQISEEITAENLRTSLRMYGLAESEPLLIVQKDEAPFFDLATRNRHRTALALPLPANTAMGSYRLELLVYDATTGEPLAVNDPRAIVGQRWPLAERIEIVNKP